MSGKINFKCSRLSLRETLLIFYSVIITALFFSSQVHPGSEGVAFKSELLSMVQISNPGERENNAVGMNSVFNGIYPFLLDFGCGSENEKPMSILQPRLPGRHYKYPVHYNMNGGRIVTIDVGMSVGAEEAFAALARGYVVFGFEPIPSSVARLEKKLKKNGIEYYKVPLTPGYAPDTSKYPMPPANFVGSGREEGKKGFLYLFQAGVGEEIGTADFIDGGHPHLHSIRENKEGKGDISILNIDSVIPSWVEEVYYAKIDTQAHELFVFKGMVKTIPMCKYIQYEFCPELMSTDRHNGSQEELLRFLPSRYFLCFDTLGRYYPWSYRNAQTIPHYLDGLWKFEYDYGQGIQPRPSLSQSKWGPWEEIVCFNSNMKT
eukprot:Nk52_evm10s684 gene=Nk52_evmTU10s684